MEVFMGLVQTSNLKYKLIPESPAKRANTINYFGLEII